MSEAGAKLEHIIQSRLRAEWSSTISGREPISDSTKANPPADGMTEGGEPDQQRSVSAEHQ